jgi:hypothetical protein
LESALTALTPRERMVFELKHYHGLKLRTVGEMLNTTEETAKNTLFRATQKLRSRTGGDAMRRELSSRELPSGWLEALVLVARKGAAEAAPLARQSCQRDWLAPREGRRHMKCDWVRQNVLFYVYNELEDDARYEVEHASGDGVRSAPPS